MLWYRVEPSVGPRGHGEASRPGEAGVATPAQLRLQLLASAVPCLGDSPVPGCWPCLCHFPCCCRCTGHHDRHHREQQLPSVPPAPPARRAERLRPCASAGKAAPAPYEQLQRSTLPVSAEEPEPGNNRVAVSLWYDRSLFTHTRAHNIPLHATQSL